MAVGVVFDGIGVTQDQYYQVFNQVTDRGAVGRGVGRSQHQHSTQDI
ncbi:MAG TPA: hypothetical protein VGW38_25445 [Chloroflexota bacterium]|nr:hypothetical protein [Chloroflexota bacterium]